MNLCPVLLKMRLRGELSRKDLRLSQQLCQAATSEASEGNISACLPSPSPRSKAQQSLHPSKAKRSSPELTKSPAWKRCDLPVRRTRSRVQSLGKAPNFSQEALHASILQRTATSAALPQTPESQWPHRHHMHRSQRRYPRDLQPKSRTRTMARECRNCQLADPGKHHNHTHSP
jgi:hypothetical protein